MAATTKKATTKVADAKSNLVIHITSTDCRKGDVKTPSSCAAAKAICRQNGVQEAQVYIGRTYVKKNGKWLRYATPPALRNEIIAFDRGGSFEPGDYTLTPVQPVVQYKNREARLEYMRKYNRRKKRKQDKADFEKTREPRRLRKSGHVVKNIRHRAGPGPDLGK